MTVLDNETTAGDTTPSEIATDDVSSTNFENLVRRLSEQSVRKHYDAYEDVPWDDHAIVGDDPRWILGETDPLGRTDWYRSLPADRQAQIGLHGVVQKMKTGLQFEGILKRGLLEFAEGLPNGAAEFRYVYHEVIEEAQHSLMFQEFVNRSGIDVPGLPWDARFGARRVVAMGRRFPELFFIFVLGGEDPIDYMQRQWLKRGVAHPLLERIMRIHVTEEARHLSFARHYLKNRVPKLSPIARLRLGFAAPMILGEMARLMLKPSKQMIREYGIPAEVIDEAYTNNEEFKADAARSLTKVRNLCVELGLVNPITKRLWVKRGIWAD